VLKGATLVRLISTVPVADTVNIWVADPSCASVPEKASVVVAGAGVGVVGVVVVAPHATLAASRTATSSRSILNRDNAGISTVALPRIRA
jgi:hypothetical protein